ncbi:MAG: hypothetical protein DID90_2727553522 [Candidatus Nitrotoga sp. LAW]|nr:MAG: hypothetical protein DID90_2727553522 [Candidatus Nitrotoga sp. LAW]
MPRLFVRGDTRIFESALIVYNPITVNTTVVLTLRCLLSSHIT